MMRYSTNELVAPLLLLSLFAYDFVAAQTSIGGGTVSGITASTFATSSSVTYQVVFENTWSAANHPPDYPSNAHWSPPVLAAHTSGYTMWQSGGTASAGVKLVAEVSTVHILVGFFTYLVYTNNQTLSLTNPFRA